MIRGDGRAPRPVATRDVSTESRTGVFIVQGKPREPAGIVKAIKGNRKEALDTANDFHSSQSLVTAVFIRWRNSPSLQSMVRNKRCPQGPKGKPVSLIAQRAARLHHDDACGDHEQYQDADNYGDECNFPPSLTTLTGHLGFRVRNSTSPPVTFKNGQPRRSVARRRACR